LQCAILLYFCRLLNEPDKRCLLGKNLDMICNVRMALRLDPTTGLISVRGLDDMQPRESLLQLEQLFAPPWAKSEEHESLFREKVMNETCIPRRKNDFTFLAKRIKDTGKK
jgi:hypothetical protein